jgi:hypothetical protein
MGCGSFAASVISGAVTKLPEPTRASMKPSARSCS